MKHIITLVTLLLLCTLGWSQVPEAFSYQAVARDANGVCLSDQTIDVKIGIRDSSATGAVVYLERHDGIMTNEQGLFSLSIGTGVPQGIAIFNTLDWSISQRWLEVEIDAGSGFEMVGSQQLMSVPYAMQAGRAYIPHAYDAATTLTASTLRNQWFTDAGIEVTVPESGTYHIVATGRAGGIRNANREWSKFRVFNITTSAEIGYGLIGFNEAGSGDAGSGDQTGTTTVIFPLQKDDVLRIDFWIQSDVSTSSNAYYGGNVNGHSTLSILKVGP